ncbi:hypothetical protein K6I33_006074 [Streptomyces sp. UNOB3_S3]|nr:hypothetical protein [Streptomyces sp. UNOB3_S3]
MRESRVNSEGYRITVELTDDTRDRFPELAADRGALTEPIALVVEFGDARQLRPARLAHELARYRQTTAVVALQGRTGRQVQTLGTDTLRRLAADAAETGRMLRLERTIAATG